MLIRPRPALLLALILGSFLATNLLFCEVLAADLPASAGLGPGAGTLESSASGQAAISFASLLDAEAAPNPGARMIVDGLPDIGLWMLAPDGSIAHWLGQPFHSRRVLEPINIVILDRQARDAGSALARLEKTLIRAGFRNRGTHSTGYSAWIGEDLRPQLHARNRKAYSDAPFIVSNDHGRIFGPVSCAAGFVFTAALSREGVSPTKFQHTLKSFAQARERFASALVGTGRLNLRGRIDLGNAVRSSLTWTTFDHDGAALLLESALGQ